MKLIVFSGLPGTGKSTLAETLGKELGIPVFAKDWLEATLVRSGLNPIIESSPPKSIGYELLTVLAGRQLRLGQSVILDSVAGSENIRWTWRQLSAQHEADWRVIECICSDESIHRARLQCRQRNIPGWHELDWSEVERVKHYYLPWQEEHLVLDMVDPVDENLFKARKYCE
jgi:predicted kinase